MLLSQSSKIFRSYALLLLVALGFVTMQAQENTFVCNGDLIITLSDSGNSTNAFGIELNGSAANFAALANYGIRVNSTAFNSQDGYIYGITGANQIIRLKSNGTFDDLGIPSFLPPGLSAAGDFDADGIYWIHHRGDQSFYGIDVNNGNVLVDQLVLQWHPSTGNSGDFDQSIDDLVFDPLDKTSMYTYQRNGSGPTITRGHLLRADMDPSSPEYGFIYSEGQLAPSEIVHIGAMFFDSQGGLFGYGAGPGPFIQDRLIKIDRNPTRANLVATGPGASANDGCSCPFSMYVTKATADSYNVCLNDTMRFDYVVGNTSNVRPDGVTFNDTFPPGFEIIDIQFSEIFGNVAPGTGVGTNKIKITDIDFANKEVEFSIFVKPSLVSGIYNIQAALTDLPSRFGSQILSDDPESFASNDPTIFIVDYALFTDNFEIGDDIIMCEGEIANFEASIPLSGTLIEWNTGESGPFASTTNEGLVIATAVLGACSDTDTALVTVVPFPEVDLPPDMTLCANESTVLGVPFVSGQTYSWSTGETSNAIVAAESGQYTLTIDDQGCATTDSTNVDIIFQDYELDLLDLTLCDGDSLEISAVNPWPVNYLWTLPGGATTTASELSLEDLATNTTGQYTVFMEYAGCTFADTFNLLVSDYPTTDLDSVLRACYDELEYTLTVPSNDDYFYTWSTGESTPSITVNESGNYLVSVDNNGCITVDSAEVDFVFEEFVEAFPDVTICEGDSIGFFAENDFPVSYLWTLADGSVVTENMIDFPIIDEVESGTISLLMEFNQCLFSTNFELNVNPQPELELDNEVTYDVCDSLTLNIDEVTPGTTIQWTPAELVNCQNCTETTLMTTESGYVTVSVVDDIGCETVDSVYLNIEDTGLGHPTNIPNIFSPNNDRNNDFFIVLPLCYKILSFEIFDRWGNNVYTKAERNPADEFVEWDGLNHVGTCTEGVYTWVGEFLYINSGKLEVLSGDVTIVR